MRRSTEETWSTTWIVLTVISEEEKPTIAISSVIQKVSGISNYIRWDDCRMVFWFELASWSFTLVPDFLLSTYEMYVR